MCDELETLAEGAKRNGGEEKNEQEEKSIGRETRRKGRVEEEKSGGREEWRKSVGREEWRKRNLVEETSGGRV